MMLVLMTCHFGKYPEIMRVESGFSPGLQWGVVIIREFYEAIYKSLRFFSAAEQENANEEGKRGREKRKKPWAAFGVFPITCVDSDGGQRYCVRESNSAFSWSSLGHTHTQISVRSSPNHAHRCSAYNLLDSRRNTPHFDRPIVWRAKNGHFKECFGHLWSSSSSTLFHLPILTFHCSLQLVRIGDKSVGFVPPMHE